MESIFKGVALKPFDTSAVPGMWVDELECSLFSGAAPVVGVRRERDSWRAGLPAWPAGRRPVAAGPEERRGW